jgi:hypothetical protein
MAMDSTPIGRGTRTIWSWRKDDLAMEKIAHGRQKAQSAWKYALFGGLSPLAPPYSP